MDFSFDFETEKWYQMVTNFPFQQLSSDFRYNYAKLWLSIINRDVEGMKKYAAELGVGDMYGLLACIVTARSWESLTNEKTGGIMGSKSTKEEVRLFFHSVQHNIFTCL